MKMIYLKLILSIALTFTVMKITFAFIAVKDIKEYLSASPDDRLPLNIIVPVNYNIQIIAKSHLFFGTSKILIAIYQKTKTIRLHVHKIKISLNKIELTKIKEVTDNNISKIYIPVSYDYCNISHILKLSFVDAIQPAFYYLTLNFTAPITNYGAETYVEYESIRSTRHRRWFYTNLLKTIKARRMFPCWDQPNIKATFNIAIRHPSKYRVLINMPIQMESKISNTEQWTYYISNRSMATTELAIIVTDNIIDHYVNFSTDYIWQYPESIMTLRFACLLIDEVRISLSKYMALNISPATQHIVIPSPVKLIGRSGVIIYRERDVTYREGLDFVGLEISIAQRITNQIASQWLSAAATELSWSNKWISESFATYFSYSFPTKFSEELEELFVVQILQPALYYDIALNLEPIEHEIIDANEIDTVLYSRFYRNKGAIFLRMLHHFLSPPKFEKHIGTYQSKLLLYPIIGKNLWKALQDVHDKKKPNQNMEDIYDWSQQRYYPELYVATDDRNVNITAICENSTNWYIPISIFQSALRCTQYISHFNWIQCNESKIISKLKKYSFIILNLLQAGYYRVNYDRRNWWKIINYLQYDDYTCIPVQNRAQLIDDAYYFAMTGKLNSSVFWVLIKYLRLETHYVAWYPMFNILYYMSSYWKLPMSIYAKYDILAILNELLKHIGYEEYSQDDGMTKTLRFLAVQWACKLGLNKCKNAATDILRTEYNSSNTKILPWWEEWVYCTGMMELDEDIWKHMLHESIETSNIFLFKYLHCTDNIKLILYYINILETNKNIMRLMESEELTKHYRFTLKRHLQKNVIRKYVLQRFTKIIDRFYQDEALLILWGDIIWNLHSKKQIQEIIEFSYMVDLAYSPAEIEFRKMIKARRKTLKNVRKKFALF